MENSPAGFSLKSLSRTGFHTYILKLITGSREWDSGEGDGTPLQYSCLESPMDGGAWWAAVHGVAESDTTERRHSLYVRHQLVLISVLVFDA